MTTSTPTSLAGMRVQRELGRGAGSIVYEAIDPHGQRYAVKLTTYAMAKSDRLIEQAIREFDIAKNLDHDNIRRVYEMRTDRRARNISDMLRTRSLFGVSEVIVVMELIDGETLDDHPVRDLALICRIFRKVARGLDAMHKAGFIHADLKPQNIMYSPEGEVKLIDLGLACKSGEVRERIQGTPGFIAPEQALSQAVTPRTDIYSFGATMYNMLTQRLVPTVLKVRQPGVTAAQDKDGSFPSPRDVNPAVPPALSTLVMQCLRMKPEDRPQTIADVRARLQMASKQIAGAEDPSGDK